jgi:outer membrane lipoprotein carrier protein
MPRLAVLLAAVLLGAPTARATSPGVDEVVAGVEARHAKVTDYKAAFDQVVVRKHLPRPLKKRGTVFFKKPGMMRWDYTQPDRVYYVSDGEVLWTYQVEDRLVYKVNVKASELYAALKFLFGEGDLRKEFDAALGAPADGLTALVLTPKVPDPNYKKLVLFVDPKTFDIRRTELTDPLDNASTITFESPSFDPLKPEGFQFTPPKGVRVEDLVGRADAPPGGPPDGAGRAP